MIIFRKTTEPESSLMLKSEEISALAIFSKCPPHTEYNQTFHCEYDCLLFPGCKCIHWEALDP